MFCSNCGNKNPDDLIFCNSCGCRIKDKSLETAEIRDRNSGPHNDNTCSYDCHDFKKTAEYNQKLPNTYLIENDHYKKRLISVQEHNGGDANIVIVVQPNDVAFIVKDWQIEYIYNCGETCLTPQNCKYVEESTNSFGISGLHLKCTIYYVATGDGIIDFTWRFSAPVLNNQNTNLVANIDGDIKCGIADAKALISYFSDCFKEKSDVSFEHLPNLDDSFFYEYIKNEIKKEVQKYILDCVKGPNNTYFEIMMPINSSSIDKTTLPAYWEAVFRNISTDFENKIYPIVFDKLKRIGIKCVECKLTHFDVNKGCV